MAPNWLRPGKIRRRWARDRASFGKLLDNDIDVLVSLSALHAQGEDRFFNFGSAGVPGVATGLDGERNKRFFASIARGPWAFELISNDRRKDDPTGAYCSHPLVAGQVPERPLHAGASAVPEQFSGRCVELQARLFAGRYDYTSILSDGTAFGFMATSQWQGGELRWLSTALADHQLMFGLEVQKNTRVEQQTLDLTTPANNLLITAPDRRTGVLGAGSTFWFTVRLKKGIL